MDLDSRRDAFCGKISVCNNLYQYGIPFTDTTLHTYSIYSKELVEDINKFAGICRVVNGLRHCRIGQIGTRPLGFNTCRCSEKLLQKYGITVVPADLSEVIFAAQKIADNDPEYLEKAKAIADYAKVPEAYAEKMPLVAKFAIAVERWRKANDCDALAIQCWDSLEQNYGCAACVAMSMLGDKLVPCACETDIAGAVSMYALTLASGRSSALMDWNNNFAEDRQKCVCTHCGNFLANLSATLTLSSHLSVSLDVHSEKFIHSVLFAPRFQAETLHISVFLLTMPKVARHISEKAS